MPLSELEVVWPLHRSHYLSPALADAGVDMNTATESSDDTSEPVDAADVGMSLGGATMAPSSVAAATVGRELAARALLAGGCLQTRVAELLHTNRRRVAGPFPTSPNVKPTVSADESK